MTELFCAVELGILLEIFIEFTPRPPNGISDKNTLEIKLCGMAFPAIKSCSAAKRCRQLRNLRRTRADI